MKTGDPVAAERLGRVVPTDKKSVAEWSERLGVTSEELLVAVGRVGTWIPAVERQLDMPKSYR